MVKKKLQLKVKTAIPSYLTRHRLVIIKPLAAILLLIIIGFFSGCRAEQDHNTIVVAGSTAVAPLLRELAAAFVAANNGIVIEVQELGTSAGINATIRGISDIAISSRAISPAETERGLIPLTLAIDGIVVVVHSSNPIYNLSLEQTSAIFRGEITNWQQVGGSNAYIDVVSREEGSGIRQTFESLANLQDIIKTNNNVITSSALVQSALICQGNGAVIIAVSGNPHAIGYLTGATMVEGLKALTIDGVAFAAATVGNGEYIFTTTFYIGITANLTAPAQQFVNFIFSAVGQDIISAAGYMKTH